MIAAHAEQVHAHLASNLQLPGLGQHMWRALHHGQLDDKVLLVQAVQFMLVGACPQLAKLVTGSM